MRENDAPFSAQWEVYSLVNLNGAPSYHVTLAKSFDEVFDALRPVCPKCDAVLTPSSMDQC